MQRGEIWWVTFNSSTGSEIKKTRPAIIVSNDSFNRAFNRFQIIPITRQIGRLYPGEAYITMGGKQQKAMADQITTADITRFKCLIGRLSWGDLIAVTHALKTQLGLF